MNIFDQLGKLHLEIDNNIAIKEFEARQKGYSRKEKKYQEEKEFNDQAYFLIMFSRLEVRINDLSDKLIDNKYEKLNSWKYKRTWDILYKRKNNNPDSIYFLDRTALLTEIGHNNYNLIERYYKQRNHVAHGRDFTIPINIQIVVIHMKRLYHNLKPKF